MTSAEEAAIIALWTEGLTHAAIAQQLGLPVGTVQSRAHRLQQRGLIPPRPKGGASPHRRAQAQPEDTPAPPAPTAPPMAPASPAPQVAPAPPAMTFVAVPEMQELLSLVQDLHARVIALEQTRVPPALPAPPATPTTHAPPAAERKDIQQWTVRLSKALIDHLKAVAYARRMAPSQLVEEWCWRQAHHEQSSDPLVLKKGDIDVHLINE